MTASSDVLAISGYFDGGRDGRKDMVVQQIDVTDMMVLVIPLGLILIGRMIYQLAA